MVIGVFGSIVIILGMLIFWVLVFKLIWSIIKFLNRH